MRRIRLSRASKQTTLRVTFRCRRTSAKNGEQQQQLRDTRRRAGDLLHLAARSRGSRTHTRHTTTEMTSNFTWLGCLSWHQSVDCRDVQDRDRCLPSFRQARTSHSVCCFSNFDKRSRASPRTHTARQASLFTVFHCNPKLIANFWSDKFLSTIFFCLRLVSFRTQIRHKITRKKWRALNLLHTNYAQ